LVWFKCFGESALGRWHGRGFVSDLKSVLGEQDACSGLAVGFFLFFLFLFSGLWFPDAHDLQVYPGH